MDEVKIRTNNKTGYMLAHEFDGIVMDQPRARGVVQSGKIPTMNTSKGCGCGVLVKDEREREIDMLTIDDLKNGNWRIRHLTPLECWILMGLCERKQDSTENGQVVSVFDDSIFDKAKAVSSDNQLYIQAGNSIVVDVLESIFESFLYPAQQEKEYRQMRLI